MHALEHNQIHQGTLQSFDELARQDANQSTNEQSTDHDNFLGQMFPVQIVASTQNELVYGLYGTTPWSILVEIHAE